MKHLIYAVIAVSMLACTSGNSSSDNQKEIDSLQQVSLDKDRQMNSLVGALIEIDDNLQKIKEKERLITLNVSTGENGGNAIEDRINRDIKVIYQLMVQNKEKITTLEKQLKQSAGSNSNLNNLVKRLNQQLKDKTLEIIKLQKQLENQSLEITRLNFSVEGLQYAVDSLESLKQATKQELAEATEQLYRGHYAFGTKKELKAENIISSDGMFSKKKILAGEYSSEYFTTIDIREIDSIPLYMPKAKVLTNHPDASYELVKAEDGALTLKITDKEKFWSLSRYLVIQVN